MNADDIARRKAQGQRIRAEEEEYLWESDQEERRRQMEGERVKGGDYRITVIARASDYERRIRRYRIVFEWVPYVSDLNPNAGKFMSHETPWSIAERHCKAVGGWKSDKELAALSGMDHWTAPKLIRHEEMAPGVWEVDVQEGTND